jgi:HlyD family secretion protein
MKKIILLSVFAALIFTACEHQESRSDAYGTFSADKVMVSAMANGQIVFMDIEEGEILEKGQLTAIIDTADLKIQIRQLESAVNATSTRLAQIDAQAGVQRQQLENLKTDISRTESLIPDGAATQKQLDDLLGAEKLIEKQLQATIVQKSSVNAEINSIRIKIESAKEALRKCYVHNPVDGVVLSQLMYSGEVATFGKPLYTIADLSTIDLKVFVSGAQLPEIAIGQSVEVIVDDGSEKVRKLRGKVAHIAENAEFTPKIIQTKEERVKLVYAVTVRVSNDGSLKIGMPGEVNF